MSFDSIPVIDMEEAFQADSKSRFLEKLRYALIEVGFLLLVNYENYGPSQSDFADIKQQTIEFFELPEHVKKDCEMINSPHFLGYSRLGNELTAGRADYREQIDLATELPEPQEGEPLYKQIEGPNLWPDQKYAPNFRPVVLRYIEQMTKLATTFRRLVCEAIGLQPNGLDSYFKTNQQCKMKLIAYPENRTDTAKQEERYFNQGVGPHRDSDFLTYIYQATEHRCSLQVQNFKGKWIPIDNVPGSLVVNVGQTLEALTDGVCKATIHRVASPQSGMGTRLSIPFFQTIDLDSHKSAATGIPADVMQLKEKRDERIIGWGADVGFQFTPDMSKNPVGYSVFCNRIKSHQDVAARWYPEILKQVLTEYSS